MKEGDRGLLKKKLFRKPKNYYKGGFETMKNLKKVLALVLACAMVFGMVATATSTGYPDVADDATYAEAVKTLSALKIIQGDENGNFNPDATITRAEMAKILCTMVNSGELSETATKFADVADNHWASGYINYAQQLGYIDGYDAVTFGPEDPVTYEQVIKLIVAALGYTYVAQENGGYPTGYLYVAADKEITKGAAQSNGSAAAPRSIVAVLANNAMNTPIMKRTSYGTEATWEPMDGTGTKAFESLLTTKLRTYKVEGKIATSYKQTPSMKDGYVDTEITKTLKIDVESVLGATPYKNSSNVVEYYTLRNVNAAGTDAADLIGYECVMYFQENDNGEIDLVAVARKSVKNVEVVLSDISQAYDSSEDSGIREADKPTLVGDKKQFSYWNDRDAESRITKIDIDNAADIIWNNGPKEKLTARYNAVVEEYKDDSSLSEADLAVLTIVPDRGSVVFVDTGNDGVYDLIRVTSYDVAVVKNVNAEEKTINFKGNMSTSLANQDIGYVTLTEDEYKDLKEYSIKKDGAAIEIKDIEENDVLSICTNDWANPTYFEIIVTRNPITGVVTEKSVRDGYVGIGGERYEVTKGIKGIALDDIKVNDEGTYYLDAEGRIAYMDASSTLNGNYAYMYRTGTGAYGDDDPIYLRLYTKEGADETYQLSEKVKINKKNTASVTTAYKMSEIGEIFGVTESSSDYATVGDVFEVSDSDLLTPMRLISNITKGTELKSKYALTGNTATDRLITYSVSDGKISEITLAKRTAEENTFGYVGKVVDAEWKESLAQFSGMSDFMAENAIVFFVDPDKSIEDYQVKTVAQLKDGNYYSPYFYAKTKDGVTAALVIEINSTLGNDLAVFDSYSSAVVDSEDVYNVTYWINGQKAETAMVVSDAAMDAVEAMSQGDVFTYAENDKGKVDKIVKIFSPGSAELAFGTNLMNMVDISDPAIAKDFKVLGEPNAAGQDPDNEVYFGFVGKVASSGSGARVTLVSESGEFASAKSVIVPEDANVIYYNPAIAKANRISAKSLAIVTESNFNRIGGGNSGDFDFENSRLSAARYAFVRVYKDVVTDVIYVRYTSN